MSELMLNQVDAAFSPITFEGYQASVTEMITYDSPARQTVRGKTPMLHFLSGIYEEYAETLEFDAAPPEYSRIGMIALNDSNEPLLDLYRQNKLQLERHRKEFGDLLWYSTALLAELGISLEEATSRPGLGMFPTTFADFDHQAAGMYASDEPLPQYRKGFRTFARGAARLIDKTDVGIIQHKRTVRGAHMLLGGMSWIAQARLDTSLADIAVGNLKKLENRAANGTVFGRGDDR